MKLWLLGALLGAWLWSTPPEQKPAYQEAWTAYYDNKYALARELTEKILKQEPDNYAALHLLGLIYHYGEGSLPRAYFCYSKARAVMEKSYRKPAQSKSSNLYEHLLINLGESAQQLERYQESLDLYELHDRLFPEQSIAPRKGWPLLKLGRTEEARRMLEKQLQDPALSRYHETVLNTLGNIEFESDNIQKSFDYFSKILEKPDPGEPVFWSNAGEAARDLLRYDQCEQLLLESTRHYSAYTYSDPWGYLAELYAAENRMPEALQALKHMQAWRISGSAQVSQNKWAECYGHAGVVLLQMGYDEKSLEIFQRLVQRQDRNSATSTAASLVEAQLIYSYCQALQRNLERCRERLSFCSWREFPNLLRKKILLEQQLRAAQRRVANLVCSNTGLVGFLQPYGPRSLNIPSFSTAAWSCFGAGAIQVAVGTSLADPRPEMKARQPYLKAILGEALLYDWKTQQAREVLEQVLVDLPRAEAKLRLRCQALLAKALSKLDRQSEALHYFQVLMDADPSQMRAVQLALPLMIETDRDSQADQARTWLYRSPRCRKARGAFVLKLQRVGPQLQGQLFGPDGTQVGSAQGKDARQFCQAFHEQAFAPVINLSQSDIHSIDGSTGAVRGGALKDLIE